MKMRKRKKAYLAAVLIVILVAVFFWFSRTDEVKEVTYDFPVESFLASDVESGSGEIDVDIFQYRSEGADISETDIDGTPALAWNNAGGTLEFSVNAPENAKYNVIVTYSLLEDSYGAIERALTVNGETQYSELNNILFSNNFINMSYPF